jgi:hypothetical protein
MSFGVRGGPEWHARRLRLATVALVSAATCFATASAGTAEAAQPTVPTVSCHTTFGVQGQHPRLPARVAVGGNPRSVRSLVAYSEPYAHLLGPSGMKCAASVGADGGQEITVWRDGQPEPRTHSHEQGLTLQVIPACVGCMYSLVCPLDPSLANRIYPGFPACPTTAPAKEKIVRRGDLLLFSDPPSVAGDADPSGGQYWAYGAAGYSRRHGAFGASCTLPNSQRWICTAALDDAIAVLY